MNDSKYKYLGKNVILFAISSFAPKLLSLLIVPLYTSKLSTGDYGTVDLMTTTAGLVTVIFTLNIMESILRFAIDGADPKKVLSIALKVINIGSAVFAALLVVIAVSGIFEYSNGMYAFLFIYYYLSVINTALSDYLRGIDRVADMVVFSLIHSFSLVLFNLLFLVGFDMGVQGYIAAILLSQAVAIIYICLKLRIWKHFVRTGAESVQLRNEMIRYSIPLIFNTMIWWVNNASDRYIVTYFWGAAVNGIYAVSYKIPSILSSFNTVFTSAWTLSAIREFDREDKDGFFANGYAVYNAGMLFVCAVLIIMTKPIAYFLFANDFFEAWKYSGPLLVSILFSGLSSYMGGIFSAVKASKQLMYSTILSAVTNIVLNFLLIPQLGAMGAAIATMISYLVMWINRLIVSRRYIRFKMNLPKNIIGYAILIFMVIWNVVGVYIYPVLIVALVILFTIYYGDIKMFTVKIIDSIKKQFTNK